VERDLHERSDSSFDVGLENIGEGTVDREQRSIHADGDGA
jgi:hypothetical protein